MKKCLNRDVIKYIAIFAMLLDHVAWYFLDFGTPLAQTFHAVGRITAPTMCFFLAQGYRYTSSKLKYALRLLAFALISQIPWCILHGTSYWEPDYNMLFTLLICLGVLCCVDKIKPLPLCIISVAGLMTLSTLCDWFFLAPVFTLVFWYTRDNERKMCFCFSCAAVLSICITYIMNLPHTTPLNAFLSSLYMLGLFLSIPLLLMYNGKKGQYKASKWVFYVFYPLHLGIIAIICSVI